MIVSLIVALDEQRVIGRDGGLPWRLSADLRRFKALTMGCHLIMGRKTFDSIGRPLPGRTSIVLTRQAEWSAPGVLTAPTLDDALRLAASREAASTVDGARRGETPVIGRAEAFVIGGAEVFRAAWPRADRLYLTRVLASVSGDVRLDDWDPAPWRLIAREEHPPDDKNDYPYAFETYERREPRGA